MAKRTWLSKRRNLSKKAKKDHKKRPMAWIGGILYFTDNHKPVPKIAPVPKADRPVIGLKALAGTST